MDAAELVGTWQMRSWRRKLIDSGDESDAFGPHPRGFINYAPDGRLMVLVVRGERRAPESSPPTEQEKLALYDSMFAYAGSYSVDGDMVMHHLDTSWNETWSGTQQIRFCRNDGRTLTYTTPPTRDPLDGRECVYTIVWEKLA